MRKSRRIEGIRARRAALMAALAAFTVGATASAAPPGDATVNQCVADHVAGQEAQLEHHLLAARARLRACAQATCPGPVARACSDLLRALEPRIPSVVLAAHDADGRDITDGALRIDGEVVPLAGLGVSRDVDPGTHELTLDRQGEPAVRQTVVVVEGERGRVVALTATAPKPPKPRSDPLRTAGFVGAGVGGLALVTAIALGAAATAEYSALKGSCAPRCPDEAVSAVRAKAIATDVLLGSGLGLVVLGSLGIFWPRAKAAPSATAAAPFLVVGPRGASAGLVVPVF